MSTADPGSVARIGLRPQRVRVVEWILIAEIVGLFGFLGFLQYRAIRNGVTLPRSFWLMPLLSAAGIVPLLWRVLRRRRSAAAIEIDADAAWLPLLFAPRKLRRVPLDEIRSIHRKTTGRHRMIGIGASRGTAITIRDIEFEDPAGAEQLEAQLRAAIAMRPGGDAQLAAIDRRAQVTRLLVGGFPWTCAALVLATGVFFVLEWSLGGWNPVATPNLMVRLGANVAPLIQTGEWWRLVSANALHANALHFGMNALGFAICGLLFERWIGWSSTLLIALAGGIGGTLASALVTQPSISVGASTMVMGLYIGWIVAMARYREALPHRAPLWFFVFIAVALVLGEFAVPKIDHAGHVGGGLAGAVAVLLLSRDPDPLSLRRPSRPAQIALLLLAAVFAVGVAQAVRYAWSWDDARRIDVDRRMLASPDAVALNDAAWDIATSKVAPPELLAAANARMRAVGTPAGLESVMDDTRATLAFRRGDPAAAVALERAALRPSYARFNASQLTRFEWALTRQLGAPLRIGPGPDQVSFHFDTARPEEVGRRVIVADLGERPASSLEVHAVALEGETPIAHLRFLAGPEAGSQMRIVEDPSGFGFWPSEVRFEVLLIDGESAELRGDEWKWLYWWYDPAVAALP